MKTQIQTLVKEAMKRRDQVALDTLRGLLTAIQYEEISQKVEPLPNDAILAVIQREAKKLKEEKDFAIQAKREEDLAKLDAAAKVLESLLPKQMEASELEKVILTIKQEQPTANMGIIMKTLKERHGGQYDGKLASELAKKIG